MSNKSTISKEHISHSEDEKLSRPAHALAPDDVVRELRSDAIAGLSPDEAAARLTRYGPNDFGEEKKVQPLQILVAQVFNAMTLVLILALAASFAIKAWIEGGVLGALILIDIVIGFFQDLQAARIVASLKSLQSPAAVVLRSSKYETVDAASLVPGDIVELKTGARVPADARLVDAVALETDEALLTGESLPARKDALVLLKEQDVSPGDRSNIVFASTIVTRGRGQAVVFATGASTEIGTIAAALRDQGKDDKWEKLKQRSNGKISTTAYFTFALSKVVGYVGKFLGLTTGTALERKLSRLFLYIFALAMLCALIVFAANKFEGRSDVVIYAISTAIGSLPATLTVVLTVTMAAGTRAMMHRSVAVRNMRSLEALGGVTNVCSDKTGTLTQGKMVVRSAWLPNHGTYSVGSHDDPYNPDVGEIEFTGYQHDAPSCKIRSEDASAPALAETMISALNPYLDVAALANHATIKKMDSDLSSDSDRWQARGDPTEIAIFVFACRFGRNGNLPSSKAKWTQVAEFPFDSASKIMSVLCKNQQSGDLHLFTKGAVERVVGRCSLICGLDGNLCEITEVVNSNIQANMTQMAKRGLRVLALASKPVISGSYSEPHQDSLQRDDFEHGLIFRGLIGIYDPPRLESKSSVLKCHTAGIQVHMLTGDHIDTARAIAIEVGILPKRLELLRPDIASIVVTTAGDFDKLSDEQIDQLPELPLVVARCTPTTKVRMIEALHRRGRNVAMTGDGVNDSPSLRRADIGIAMGLNGSDVAKSASDIILRDDNFASILNAIEEGRRIFDNVQKFLLHVLAANVGFVITLLVGLAFKDQDGVSVFPLSPVEILFMLLVAGAFTETGLGFEAASPDILQRPPQNLKYGVFTPEFFADLAVYGLLITACMLGSFVSVLFGLYGGRIGVDCNIKFSLSCDPVFRARSTCYTVMMWVFLFFAWELIDSRRSLFYGIVSNSRAWVRRLTSNKPLFWTVILGFVIVFPTLYIPGVNHFAFLHQGLGKEWGIVFAMTFAFFIGCDTWKWQKRIYLRRKNLMAKPKQGVAGNDEENIGLERLFIQVEGS